MLRKKSNSSELLDRLLLGETGALARAITWVENRYPSANALLVSLPVMQDAPVVVGFTGAPGVGKSTLINSYTIYCRKQQRRVAVLSVDPSSPINGGAILGDRLRMSEHADDAGVYIRSLASRGHLGGLCSSISDVIRVVGAAGFDLIILETVGTGQSEVEVASVADINVVINAPGMGDAVQAMKSGILEIADILVVNKADMPQSGQTSRELRAMLQLRPKHASEVVVTETVATKYEGIEKLSQAIDACHTRLLQQGTNQSEHF